MIEKHIKNLLALQQSEINDYVIYTKLAKKQKDQHNKDVLKQIAQDELGHYQFWENVTKRKVKPSRLKVWFFFSISRIFGLTFGSKLMEKGEIKTQYLYKELLGKVEGLESIIEDEAKHELALIDSLDEEKLKYIGSIVLGLNDALVELTGTLAGLTLAFGEAEKVGLAGLITGIAASLSMASSEYLSTKQEGSHSYALKSALYTGIAYVFAVIFMILPYFLVDNVLISLAITISVVVFIIFIFNYYISVAKDYSFKKRFLEMVSISLGVAALSFVIGFFADKIIG
ncbi:MAG: rubrerythrin family protein [Haloplasmataceae bacterium]|jgi:VIT1/CCC1 family predicted Fe2+/Mn2+ transporter|nr:rubrerythrin family protein [Haloplasmataceae bacterium]